MRAKMAVRMTVLLFLMTLCVFHAGRVSAEQELIVSAAASLSSAFPEIGKQFERTHPGVKVVFNFAASGPLLQQIEKGAPVDVFASADQKTMDQAGEKNLIQLDTRKDFVSNQLVLIVPEGSKLPIRNPQDLSGKEIGKIALGNPDTVPAGRYTREVLNNEGLWETLNPKFIYGDSVRQVLDYVSRGEVEAGFVFATDAAIAKGRVHVVADLEKHKPIVYPIGVVASSQNRGLSEQFIDYVLGQEGQEILSQYGFGKP